MTYTNTLAASQLHFGLVSKKKKSYLSKFTADVNWLDSICGKDLIAYSDKKTTKQWDIENGGTGSSKNSWLKCSRPKLSFLQLNKVSLAQLIKIQIWAPRRAEELTYYKFCMAKVLAIILPMCLFIPLDNISFILSYILILFNFFFPLFFSQNNCLPFTSEQIVVLWLCCNVPLHLWCSLFQTRVNSRRPQCQLKSAEGQKKKMSQHLQKERNYLRKVSVYFRMPLHAHQYIFNIHLTLLSVSVEQL